MKRLKNTASEYIDDDFLSGTFNNMDSIESHLEKIETEIDLDNLKKEIYYIEKEYEPGDPKMDNYLAPKLHKILNLPRSVGSDSGFWRYLSVVEFKDFVRHRWAVNGKVSRSRYWGAKRRNTFSRLWWAAELTVENGNYDLTEKLFSDLGQDQYEVMLMGSKISNYPYLIKILIHELHAEKRDVYRAVIQNLNRLLTTVLLEALDREALKEIIIELKKAVKKNKRPSISSLEVFN